MIKVGDQFTNRIGHIATVTDYVNSKDIGITFNNTLYKKRVDSSALRKGGFKDKLAPVVYGVGYIGDGAYNQADNKTAYQTWRDMLGRCYCPKYQSQYPTYKGCAVTKNWLNYQNFVAWFDENYRAGYHLDKDLLVLNNKIYSPTTCRFVPPAINSLLLDSAAIRGESPQGVYKTEGSGRYCSHLKMYGKLVNLGTFSSVEEAFAVYKYHKENYVKEVAEKHFDLGNIDRGVFDSLIRYQVPMQIKQ